MFNNINIPLEFFLIILYFNIACDCDREGTLDLNCNKETGQCVCRPGYTGIRCDQCDNGYHGDRMCTMCNCDVGTTEEICHKSNGTCICGSNFAGERCNECAPGFYNFPNCLRKLNFF